MSSFFLYAPEVNSNECDNMAIGSGSKASHMRKQGNRYRKDRKKRRFTIRRGLKGLLFLSLVFSGVVLLSAALAHSYYAILEAPWLRVEEIRISGLKHVERKDILNTLRVSRHTSVLNLRLSDLAKRLESLPWLRTSVVRLDAPGRLVVEVTEREPLAVVRADDCYLVDKDGKLFLKTTPEDHPDILLVTGFAGPSIKEGGFLPSDALEELKDLLAVLNRRASWPESLRVGACHREIGGGYVLQVGPRALPVHLGSENLAARVARLEGIVALLNERQCLERVTRIDMGYSGRAFVEGCGPAS